MNKKSAKMEVTMINCKLCGHVFKNGAGLAGHMRFSHPSASIVDGRKIVQRLIAIEDNLETLEIAVRENAISFDKTIDKLRKREL